MRYVVITLLACTALFYIACDKAAPAVDADLTGYTLTPVAGSDFFLATKYTDSVKVQEGYVLNGRKNGLWLDYAAGNIVLIQNFIEGKLNGPVLAMDARGQVTARTEYRDGILHGLKAIYKFGRPQEEIPYVNGNIEGVMRKYYTNNKVMEEAEYKNNVQDGYYRHYNEEGVVDLEYVYKNGEKVSGGIVNPGEGQ